MSETKQLQTGFADVNGTRLYYEVAGTGHPLVLIHGGLVNRRLWDDQFEVFADHYKVIRFDVRSFGDSAPITPETPPYSLEEDLYHLLKFLGIEKTYVLGLSMGGAMAIDFTLMYPEMVDALIPVAMGLSGFESDEADKREWAEVSEALKSGDVARAVELTLRTWTDGPLRTPEQVNPAVREKVRAMTTALYSVPEDENATPPSHQEPPAISRLSEIRVPTLIIVGDQDVRDILKIADILEKGIPGAKKVIIPGTAHHLNLEKPEEFNRIVLDFLGSLHRLSLMLVVNGQPYEVEVNPKEIYHEALEHALPEGLLRGHRIRISTPNGDEVFPDMFIGESVAHFKTSTFNVEATPLSEATSGSSERTWTNFGFDHLAITVADREDAKAFFSEVLGMTIVRDDRHQLVLTTGNTALFCFDAEEAPLSDGLPSRWHHIGFVVDNLDAAYHHLARHAELRRERVGDGSGSIDSDFILLERNERWSLYCHYRNGDTRLMIQLSEIKPESRGFVNPQHYTDHMYDYLSGQYGVRFEDLRDS